LTIKLVSNKIETSPLFISEKRNNMTKKEIIWREILFQAIENKKIDFTQKELAQKYGFSLSTVFNALKIPRASNIIEGKRGLRVSDTEKLLYIWATFRKLKKDIIYQTAVSKDVFTIEGEMPPGVIFGGFSAFARKYGSPPADYDKVYVYIAKNQLNEIKNRFPKQKGRPNLFILLADPFLKQFGQITPDCQTFADLWNVGDWYAKDFLQALKEKIFA